MITLVVELAILGVVLWAIETYLPISAPIKLIIRIVVVLIVVMWLAQLFGLTDLPIPRLQR